MYREREMCTVMCIYIMFKLLVCVYVYSCTCIYIYIYIYMCTGPPRTPPRCRRWPAQSPRRTRYYTVLYHTILYYTILFTILD